MARTLTLAAIQFSPSDDVQDNITRVAGFIREAAAKGADVVLPPELFCGHYFCKTQQEEHFARAAEWTDHPAVRQLSELAADHRDTIAEIDLNPVIVHAEGKGATIADALIVTSKS